MIPYRANLETSPNNSIYLILTIILISLSVAGFFFLKTLSKHQDVISLPDEKSIFSGPATNLPSDIVPPSEPSDIVQISSTPTASPSAKSSELTATPKVTSKPRSASTIIPSLSTTIPTPAYQTFVGDTDKFTAIYQSSRKVYSDQEASGNRYTFYLSTGNIAVHIGHDWSWVYPNRQFNQSLLISGYSTFIYDIDTQTIVDFQVGDHKYTIQCVHNGNQALKIECQQFLIDFKIN